MRRLRQHNPHPPAVSSDNPSQAGHSLAQPRPHRQRARSLDPRRTPQQHNRAVFLETRQPRRRLLERFSGARRLPTLGARCSATGRPQAHSPRPHRCSAVHWGQRHSRSSSNHSSSNSSRPPQYLGQPAPHNRSRRGRRCSGARNLSSNRNSNSNRRSLAVLAHSSNRSSSNHSSALPIHSNSNSSNSRAAFSGRRRGRARRDKGRFSGHRTRKGRLGSRRLAMHGFRR